MNDKRVLIIGMGWLGKQIASELKKRDFSVSGTCRNPEEIKEADFKLHAFDFPQKINLPLNDFDGMILCIPPNKCPEYEALAKYITKELTKKPSSIRHVLFCSSTSVYDGLNGSVTESHSLLSFGIISVFEQELTANGNSIITILRLGGLIGKNRNPGTFLAGRKGLDHPNLPVNLVQGTDVAKIAAELLFVETKNEVYNLVSDEHPSRKEYYTQTALELGLTPPEFTPESYKTGKIISNKKICERLPEFKFRSIYNLNP